jgi:ABC-type sulfate transport system permease subunit
MSVAVVVPFVARLICPLMLQLVSNGKPEHVGATVTLPLLLNPFCAVNVRVVDPDCPGAATLTVVGFAVTVNVGAGVTLSATVALELA